MTIMRRILRSALRPALHRGGERGGGPRARHRKVTRNATYRTAAGAAPSPLGGSTSAPSDASEAGGLPVSYAPERDGQPDPGEVVWAWVPFEDDPAQGKDRPVLVVGRDGPTLLALQLTSQDHDLDAEDEARYGRHWMDIGTGDWDASRRPSEVRLDRLLRLAESEVRREGAALDRPTFDAVVAAAREHHTV